MKITPWIVHTVLLTTLSAALAQPKDAALTLESINSASLEDLVGHNEKKASEDEGATNANQPDAAVVRLQILLDRAGISPGVIDGFHDENVRKALSIVETMEGLQVDGELDADIIRILQTSDPVLLEYTITKEDVESIVDGLPEDYAELAKRDHLGFTSVAEALAEKFHMDLGLFETLNPDATLAEGKPVIVAKPGDPLEGKVARIEADKRLGQVRAYDNQDELLAAYPATVGSDENPSPVGTHIRSQTSAPCYMAVRGGSSSIQPQ